MTIDAKIRISAIVDQAMKALRELKAEAAGVAGAAAPQGKVPFSDIGAGAKDAAAQTKAARDEAVRLRAEQKAAAAEAKAQADAAKKIAKEQKAAADEAAKAQRAAANQARQLAPQLTDIVVGLSTGQSPFTVLLQQGGQLKDVFGGVGNAVKALLSVFTAARVVVGGIALAFGSIAFAAVQGQQESAALAKNLALTGNIAATSAGQLDAQAKAIAQNQKASIGDVRETLTSLVASGQFTSTTLESAGKAAVALSKLTGESAADSIKQFDSMSAGVSAWAVKANQAYNFLSVEQFKYIQSLEAQGRTQDAMKVALDALATTMEQRSGPAIGVLEKAWNAVKAATSGVLDNLKAIGRDTTPEEQVKKLTKAVEDLERARDLGSRGGKRKSTFDADIEAAKQARDAAIETERLMKSSAARQADQAAATQKKISEQSKGYQDSLSQIDAAGVQKRLTEELAALDLRQAAIERQNANGLLSEADYSAKLNQIDQQRLVAQAATVRRQIEIEGSRTVTNPTETNARTASVKALEAQLAEVQGRIAAAGIKAQADAESIGLQAARDQSARWGDIWQRAADQVRTLTAQNGATQASLIADPVARATAEAASKVSDLQRQVTELQRDLDLQLSLTIKPGERAALQQQINDLSAQSKKAIDEATRTATFDSLKTQFADLNQALTLQEQRLSIAVDQGALTTVDAEQRKFAARAQALPQLEAILRAMEALGSTQAEKNAIESTIQEVDRLKDATTEFQKTARASATDGLVTTLNDIETGAKSAKAGLLDMASSFAKAMLDVLNKKLANQLVNQFTDAISGNGGFLSFLGGLFGGGSSGAVSSAGTGLGATFAHTGAVIGGQGGWKATVPAAAFAYAPRYHSGGIAGFKPREVPSVLEVGEEVLTEDNPRHIKNFKSSVNGISINTQITGAQGTEGEQRTAADDLTQQMLGVINNWASTQSRQGGILAKGTR